jgi:hypothetical protein
MQGNGMGAVVPTFTHTNVPVVLLRQLLHVWQGGAGRFPLPDVFYTVNHRAVHVRRGVVLQMRRLRPGTRRPNLLPLFRPFQVV